jgi:RNA polymerase sigma-70 factor (ECF subfamily)
MHPDADGRSDAELLRASFDDPEAFGVFYDRHVAAVVSFLVRRTGCPQVAADLTAETFAAAFVARRGFRRTATTGLPWLLGIARNKLAGSLRDERVEDTALRKLGMERIDLDDRSLERIEELGGLETLRTAVEQALAGLTPSVAEAVTLRVVWELPYVEVARRLGCSEGAARVRVARGLSAIAESLESRA